MRCTAEWKYFARVAKSNANFALKYFHSARRAYRAQWDIFYCRALLISWTCVAPGRVAHIHLCALFMVGPPAAQMVPDMNTTSLWLALPGVPTAPLAVRTPGGSPLPFGSLALPQPESTSGGKPPPFLVLPRQRKLSWTWNFYSLESLEPTFMSKELGSHVLLSCTDAHQQMEETNCTHKQESFLISVSWVSNTPVENYNSLKKNLKIT